MGQFSPPPLATSPKTAAVAAQDYYAACMDTATIARLGTEPLGVVLQRITAMTDTRQLAQPVADLHRVGVASLFRLNGAGLRAMPADNSTNRAHLTALFELLGDTSSAAAEEARAALSVGTSLDQARRHNAGPRQAITRAELAQLVPNFDWTSYFQALGRTPALRGNPGYLQALNGRLLTVSLADWKSYLRFQWLDVASPLLPPAFAREQAALRQRPLPTSRAAACRAAVGAYTPAQLLAARISRDDYLGDTMRLRMVQAGFRIEAAAQP
jgi:predicted metalloendopeptidase